MHFTLRAELTDTDTCAAAGIAACGPSPVLTLCRRLVAGGHDPSTRMVVYRGESLALTVPSIGAGAELTVREETRDGRPRLTRYRPYEGRESSGGAPPVAWNENSDRHREAAE